jgi:predicted metal-dependent hydrolase
MPRQLAFLFDQFGDRATVENPQPHRGTTPASPAFTLVFVRHPQARRYLLRVFADATVRVTIPRWGSRKEAAAFADRERAWIQRQLRRIAEEEARHATRPDEHDPARPLMESDSQVLTERELVDRARCELVPRLNELARIHKLTVERVSIRNQRSRWGSCSPRSHICLNWRLITLPAWVRDYVLIHELMHLKRMDHSPRFWKLVEKACPDYQLARRYLRDHSPAMVPRARDRHGSG